MIINRDSYGDVSSLLPVHPSRVVPGLYRGEKYYKISGNDGLQRYFIMTLKFVISCYSRLMA